PQGFVTEFNYEKQRTGSETQDVTENGGVNGGVNEGVNEGVNLLLQLITEKSGRRMPYYAKEMGVPEKTIERWLKQLKDENKI
ncbi:MAG: hypothetical protein JST52_10025, partial [Bacteroidetes bacterium]|nr:hypothetical protein [Bacteroidota bacterium]